MVIKLKPAHGSFIVAKVAVAGCDQDLFGAVGKAAHDLSYSWIVGVGYRIPTAQQLYLFRRSNRVGCYVDGVSVGTGDALTRMGLEAPPLRAIDAATAAACLRALGSRSSQYA